MHSSQQKWLLLVGMAVVLFTGGLSLGVLAPWRADRGLDPDPQFASHSDSTQSMAGPRPMEGEPQEGVSHASDRELEAESTRETAGGERVVYESSVTFLQDFWGPRWPQLREELERFAPERLARYESTVLTEDLVPPPLADIHEEAVRRLLEMFDAPSTRGPVAFRARAGEWPSPLTGEFLERRFGTAMPHYSAEQVERADRVADSFRARLEAAREVFFEHARVDVEQEARQKHYLAWPLLYVGQGIDASTGVVASESSGARNSIRLIVSLNGIWILQMDFDIDSRPHLKDLWEELAELGHAREAEVEEELER